MSDLPSREEVARWRNLPEVFDGPISHVLRAYASGRLVDREANGTEWLCIEQVRDKRYAKQRRISNLPGNQGHCYFTSKPSHLTDCGEFVLVAAIGGSDEK